MRTMQDQDGEIVLIVLMVIGGVPSDRANTVSHLRKQETGSKIPWK
jgi:hypothetical protein